MPKISVVVPAYNAEKYIKETIESILSQTFKDFELIIVDDGSTDSTAEIINSFNDQRIVYLKNEKNMRISDTLNRGISVATGEYIARMDSDDIALPQRFQKQVAFLDKHKDIYLLGSAIEIFGESINSQIRKFNTKHQRLLTDMLFSSAMAHPTVMMRRSLFSEEGFTYNPHFNGMEDYVLFWQIALKHNVATLPDVLLRYRIHNSQITQNPTEKHKDNYIEFKKIQFGDLGIDFSQKEFDAFYYSACTQKPLLFKTSFQEIEKIYNKLIIAFNNKYLTKILTNKLIFIGKKFMLSTKKSIKNSKGILNKSVVIKAYIIDFLKFFSRKKDRILNLFATYSARKELKTKDFTIISNNCWGGFMYQKYGLAYTTPTVGLLIFGKDYIKFCANLKHYTKQTLEFIPFEEASLYDSLKDTQGPYPVAKLDDIEIYFMHYSTNEEAAEKWYRRCERINWDNIVYKISQREFFTDNDIYDFINLKHKNFLCFAPFKDENTIYIPNINTINGDEVPVIAEYFNPTEYLNNLKR